MAEDTVEESSMNGWHLDKKVPLGLIFAIFLQTVGVVWFFSGLAVEVKNNAVNIQSLDTNVKLFVEEVGSENLRQWDRINSTEARVEGLFAEVSTNQAILQRVEEDIDEMSSLLREYLREVISHRSTGDSSGAR